MWSERLIDTYFGRVSARIAASVVAFISIVSMAFMSVAAAQDVGPGNTVIAVSDSDGSTDNIQPLIEKAEASGAEVKIVEPDESERSEGSNSTEESSGTGDPSSESGEIDRDLDGDLLREETLAGVEMMEPKVESAFQSIPNDHGVFVVAEGNGAGAAGNVLEKMAFDEGPIDKTRIIGNVLIGDPYRTGSTSEQSASRDEFQLSGLDDEESNYDDEDSVGFISDSKAETDLPEGYTSEADKRVSDELAQAQEDNSDDRVGENNGSDESEDLDSSGQNSDSENGQTANGRSIVPDRIENYGENPLDNPSAAPITPRSEKPEDSEDSSSSSEDSEVTGQSGESLDSGTTDGGSSSSSSSGGEEDPHADFEDNYVPDDWEPGDGTDGADVNEARPANPDANRGEGAMGDGEIWSVEQGRASSEREITSGEDVSTSSRVTTPGTGVLGQRERGLGDLDDSTLSVCSDKDERCASNGISTMLAEVITGDLRRSPQLAAAMLKGLISLGKLIASIDKQDATKLGTLAVKCNLSITTVAASGAAGAGAISSGVAAGAAVPAAMSAAVSAGGASQSCGQAASAGFNMAADIYRQYKSDPDLIQASEMISLIDPDSEANKVIQAKTPVEFQNPGMKQAMRKMARVGYALDDIRADEYMEEYASGAEKASELNPMAISSLLTTTLMLSDAIVKAITGVEDQTMFGELGMALSGTVGSSTMLNTFGTATGKALTQQGSQYDPSMMTSNVSTDSNSDSDSSSDSVSDSDSESDSESSSSSSSSGNRKDEVSGDSSSNMGDMQLESSYGDRYREVNYSDMNVAEGINALDFAGNFVEQNVSG